MAHADYRCCAICDRKLAYDENTVAKCELCAPCAVSLAKLGVFVSTPAELIDWITKTEKLAVAKTLLRVGFRKCYYPNPVDDAVFGRQDFQLTEKF